MDQPEASKKREITATLAVLIVVTLIVMAVSMTSNKKSVDAASKTSPVAASQSSPTANTTTAGTTTTAGAPSGSGYTDGSYTATSMYESPGGEDSITVNVTLKDGVITATSAESGSTSRESQEYEDRFIASYKSRVVGKSIAGLSLNRVSGASLTTQGFNDAIQQIESEAHA